MRIQNIGITCSLPAGLDLFSRMESLLERVWDAGFRLVEIHPHPFAIIVDGRIRPRQLDRLRSLLSQFDFQYTIHGLNRLNLAYDRRHDLCVQIMRCQIEICRAVGATCLVYHSGLQALDAVKNGVASTLPSDEELIAGEQREVRALRVLAPAAADAGVVIGIENGDPHLWEHEIIRRFGYSRQDLLKFHKRLHPSSIANQLEHVDHPSVGMTLDIAHLHIAASDMRFDYLQAVELAAPWVVHLHANDNFGRLDTGVSSEAERWAFGEADCHMPPGWGCIPYKDVFERLSSYTGDLILEIKPGFADYIGESLETMLSIVNPSSQASPIPRRGT